MMEFENNPQILSLKAELKEIFLSIIDTVKNAFVSFYKWLKEVPLPAPPTMLKIFSHNRANLIIFMLLGGYMLFINIRTYILFTKDKQSAAHNKERIPESRLFKYMWLGGAGGAALAMFFKRHKTQHPNFVITAAVLVLLQLILFSFALGFFGFWAFF